MGILLNNPMCEVRALAPVLAEKTEAPVVQRFAKSTARASEWWIWGHEPRPRGSQTLTPTRNAAGAGLRTQIPFPGPEME